MRTLSRIALVFVAVAAVIMAMVLFIDDGKHVGGGELELHPDLVCQNADIGESSYGVASRRSSTWDFDTLCIAPGGLYKVQTGARQGRVTHLELFVESNGTDPVALGVSSTPMVGYMGHMECPSQGDPPLGMMPMHKEPYSDQDFGDRLMVSDSYLICEDWSDIVLINPSGSIVYRLNDYQPNYDRLDG